MTKIVSFAPPRASSSQSLAKGPSSTSKTPGKSKASPKPRSAAAQTSLSLSFDEEPAAQPAKKAAAKPVTAKVAAAKPAATKPPVELKGTKVRAPKNLDSLYGAKTEERPNAPTLLEPESPKKRLSKVQREARKALMKPDEGLLDRLARATQIPIVKVKAEPRGKGWKFLCGRCGTVSYFQTQAGLCECGAIAIKD